MIRSILIVSVVFFPLTACLGSAPQQSPVSTCSGYGYKYGSSDFRNCVAEESRLQKQISSDRGIARRKRAQDNFQNSWYCKQGGCN